MVNLLTSGQIRKADEFTVATTLISAQNLMEQAAAGFVSAFVPDHPDREMTISIYCGTGNNGGDGLAIARHLSIAGYRWIKLKVAYFNAKHSPEFTVNLLRARQDGFEVIAIDTAHLQDEPAHLVIDALLGAGLNRPLTRQWKKLVTHLNRQQKTVIGVDIPTGFYAEGAGNEKATVLKCTKVLTFQQPKISFFFPEAAAAMDEFQVIGIGLDEAFISSLPSHFKLVTAPDIRQLLKPRKAFSHKGTYGHTLVIAGQTETMGAALLCSGASVYAGSGLTTAYIPAGGLSALNSSYPEVMAMIRKEGHTILEPERYTSVVIGPGLGKGADAREQLDLLIGQKKSGMVIDADGLTLLAEDPGLLASLPAGTLLTPHMKEFDRLFGNHTNWWKRVETARKMAGLHQLFIVLKNRYTFIITPQNNVFINSSGTPAMATGGMGDVLAGVIGSLLSQGYAPEEAAIAGVYIHGKCGEQLQQHVVTASQVIQLLPRVMNDLVN